MAERSYSPRSATTTKLAQKFLAFRASRELAAGLGRRCATSYTQRAFDARTSSTPGSVAVEALRRYRLDQGALNLRPVYLRYDQDR